MQMNVIEITGEPILHGEKKKFIYNAKCLNPTLTIREADIHNDGNIFVVSTRPPKKDECKIF